MTRKIKIIDWAGNKLYEGPYNSPMVDKVLDANRCQCSKQAREQADRDEFYLPYPEQEPCDDCNDTGYDRDFHVEWADETITDNVYEWIHY